MAGFPVYLSLHVCFGDQKVAGFLDTCISGSLILIIPKKLYKIISSPENKIPSNEIALECLKVGGEQPLLYIE